MNKKILLTLLFALVCISSVTAISASDANMTDSNTVSSSDDVSQILEETHSGDAESVNSNILSADNEDIVLESNAKNNTQLTPKSDSAYYKGSYEVTLQDSNSSSVIADRDVNFIIGNDKYVVKTDKDGIARLNLTLNPGKYSLTAYFSGDDLYEPSANLTSTVQIESTIKASDITKYYKGSTQYTATFFDSYGNVLSNRDVTITVNGKTYTRKTNSKGTASLPVDLQPGTYKVTATNPLTGEKVTTTFKILPTISASNLKKVVGDKKKFQAKFYKSNGKALANKKVKFRLNGKTYKVKTNSKGVAKLSVKNLKKGKYSIICYNKDGSSKTFKIRVYKKVGTTLTSKDYTFQKSDAKKKIKATLLNSLGYTPGKGFTVKIKINGKTYYKKTNKKGVVSLKLPSMKKGIYTAKFKFAGTSNYKASKVNKLVTVLSKRNAKFTVKSTTTFGYGAGTQFKLAVTAGGVPLAKRAVTLNVDGKTYTKTTDKSGMVSLPITLEIGNYTMQYSIKKESKVDAKSGSCKITVKERAKSKLTWKSGTSFGGSPQTFKVLLTDENGKAISGQTVKVTINSKTYKATTASNGYATIIAYAPIGTYTASVKFAGSNDYLSSSTSQSVTITYAKSIKGVTEKNTISDLSAYLKSSSHCQVGNAKIKDLVTKLTKGLSSDYDKAQAIFNYVRDEISYSFYYDTNYGAVGTLNAGRGNCVDQSHLLVAMFRTAGLAARYVHGTCHFSSGSTYGHVWTQVLIGDTWVCADPTSSRNSFGKIVNWNTNSFTLHSRYASLPF